MMLPALLLRRRILRKWRRWRSRRFLNRLRKDLLRLDDRLRHADYKRHERRRICRELLGNIEAAVQTYFREDK